MSKRTRRGPVEPVLRLHHLLIDAEAVASMPAAEVEEALRELGLDPHRPLPHRVRRLKDAGDSESRRRVLYYEHVLRRLCGKLRLTRFSPALPATASAVTRWPARRVISFGPSFIGSALAFTFILLAVSPGPRPMLAATSDTLAAAGVVQRTVDTQPGVLPVGARVRLSSDSGSAVYDINVVPSLYPTEPGRYPSDSPTETWFQATALADAAEVEEEIKGLELRVKELEAEMAATHAKANVLPATLKWWEESSEKAKALKAKVSRTNVGSLPPARFMATAYSLSRRTANGGTVSRDIIAADRSVYTPGTHLRLSAGPWSGEYVVAETDGDIRGRKIDIWIPSEATRLGRPPVKFTILSDAPERPSPTQPQTPPAETRGGS